MTTPGSPSSPVRWAAGWYVTKRHVVLEDGGRGSYVRAVCSPYTSLYPAGRPNAVPRYSIPVADSEQVMALPACKHCARFSTENEHDQPDVQSPMSRRRDLDTGVAGSAGSCTPDDPVAG